MAKNTIIPDEEIMDEVKREAIQAPEKPKRLNRPINKPAVRNLSFDEFIRFKAFTLAKKSAFRAYCGATQEVVYNTQEGWDKLFKEYSTREITVRR